MRLARDVCPFPYEGYHGRPAHCRIRIFYDPDRPVVVIATELPSNPGTSITNRAEVIASEVCRRYSIDPDTLTWIEHYLGDPRERVDSAAGEHFSRAEFQRDAGRRLVSPRWYHMPKRRVETLIGQPLTS
jgi:hypothetical protein